MTRIAIIDRTDMDTEQARVHDTAKQSGGPVGGPYFAYIRLPKLFEAAQNLRACLASGPLSRREQQIVESGCCDCRLIRNSTTPRLSRPRSI